MEKSVVHVLSSDIKNDSRVLKELSSLNTFQVFNKLHVLHQGDDRNPSQGFLLQKVQIISIKPVKLSYLGKNAIVHLLEKVNWCWRAFIEVKNLNPTVVHCHDIEPLFVGFLAKIFLGKKVIYDAHEFETETKSMRGMKKYFWQAWETIFIRSIDELITVSPAIAANYKYRYGIKNITLILNCPIRSERKPGNLFHQKFGLPPNELVFLYQGGLHSGRGLELLLETFKNLPREIGSLVIMGYGPMEKTIQKFCIEHNNVYFHEAVHPGKVFEYACSADIGFCLTDLSCLNHRYCLPNKVFEYIQAGLAVISTPLVEIQKIISNFDIGICISDEKEEDLKQAIIEVVTHHKRMKHNTVPPASEYNWENQASKLKEIYTRLLSV
jgi:glycosyltransferase involved in cell wall biosynthesis